MCEVQRFDTHALRSQALILLFLVSRNLSVLLSGLGHELSKVLFLALGNGFWFHLDDKGSAQVLDRVLDRFDCLLQSIYGCELIVDRVNLVSRSHRHCSKYLVGGVCTQNIQWWGNELRFNWDSIVTLFFSSFESLLDGVNAGRCVACELDVGTEFDGKGGQTTSNRSGEDGEGGGGDGLGEASENGFWFAV